MTGRSENSGDPPVSTALPALELQRYTAMPSFYVGVRDHNSGPLLLQCFAPRPKPSQISAPLVLTQALKTTLPVLSLGAACSEVQRVFSKEQLDSANTTLMGT